MKKLTLKRKKLFSFLVPLVIIALLVGGLVLKRSKDALVEMKTKTIPNVVQVLAGNATKIQSVENLKEESGIYSFDLTLDSAGQVNKYTSYITKDGKIFFASGTKVSELQKADSQAAAEPQAKLTCDDVNKSATPKMTAFVVADCPFGLQMQRVMNKAITEQPALKDAFEVKYIGAIEGGKITSMHGDAEAQENLRQICIREEQKNLYWPYVACYMKAQGKSAECLTQTGVNVASVNACMADAKRGNTYAQKDFDLMAKYDIGSSPTLLVNESQVVSEFDFGGRTPNALKEVLCCASSTKAGYCGTALSTDDVAASFSETGEASANTSAANCN